MLHQNRTSNKIFAFYGLLMFVYSYFVSQKQGPSGADELSTTLALIGGLALFSYSGYQCINSNRRAQIKPRILSTQRTNIAMKQIVVEPTPFEGKIEADDIVKKYS